MSGLRVSTLSFAACSVLTLAMASPTRAATDLKLFMTHPAGACQGSLPNSEGKIRKRPLAVVNEGTSSAFVTCSFTGFFDESMNFMQVYVYNYSTAPLTIFCTAVTGSIASVSAPVYTTRGANFAPGTYAILNFTPADGHSTEFPSSVSCTLPPGGAIGNLYFSQNVDIGA